jgi:hypothetical protein
LADAGELLLVQLKVQPDSVQNFSFSLCLHGEGGGGVVSESMRLEGSGWRGGREGGATVTTAERGEADMTTKAASSSECGG